MCAWLLILPFCRCIAIRARASGKIRSESEKNWLAPQTQCFHVNPRDSKDDLCEENNSGQIASLCFCNHLTGCEWIWKNKITIVAAIWGFVRNPSQF